MVEGPPLIGVVAASEERPKGIVNAQVARVNLKYRLPTLRVTAERNKCPGATKGKNKSGPARDRRYRAGGVPFVLRRRQLRSGAEVPDRVNLLIVTVGGWLLPVFMVVGQIASGQSREPTPVRIEFEAPNGCSSVDAFYEGVHGRTDRVRWALDGEDAVQIRIKLFRAGTKIRGELRLSDQEGEKETRRVDGATCDEVVEALSLTVTLAVDPSALLVARKAANPAASDEGGAAATPSLAPPARKSPATSEVSSDPSKTRSTFAASPSTIHSEFGAQLLAASVTSPGASFGGAISARFIIPSSTLGQWSTGLTLLHVQNDLLNSANWGVFALTALALDLCPLRGSAGSQLDAELCAVAMGGLLYGSGVVAHPDSVSRNWWSLGLRGAASVGLAGGLRLELSMGAQAPIIRREFITSLPVQHVGETPRIAVLGGLGLALRF